MTTERENNFFGYEMRIYAAVSPWTSLPHAAAPRSQDAIGADANYPRAARHRPDR